MTLKSLASSIGYIKITSFLTVLVWVITDINSARSSMFCWLICYFYFCDVIFKFGVGLSSVGNHLVKGDYFYNADRVDISSLFWGENTNKESIILMGEKVATGLLITAVLGFFTGACYLVILFSYLTIGARIKPFYKDWIEKQDKPVLENARYEFLVAMQDESKIKRGGIFVKGKGVFILEEGYPESKYNEMLDWLDFDYDPQVNSESIMKIHALFDLEDGTQLQRFEDSDGSESWLIIKQHDISNVKTAARLLEVISQDSEDGEDLIEYLEDHPEEIKDEANRTRL